MNKCFRCHKDEGDRFRIMNQVFCFECYKNMLDKICILLEKDRLK